jgi:hypothetical protein
MALLVLRHLRVRVGRCITDHDGHHVESSTLGSAATHRAEVDEVATSSAGVMHDDRLQDATLADVVGQRRDRRLGEVGARVVRIFVDQVQRDEQRVTGLTLRNRGAGSGRRCRASEFRGARFVTRRRC